LTVIHGVGVDLVQVERLRQALVRHGDRFARRLLADKEYQQYQTVIKKDRLLAKRFAAKEAFLKALGTGLRHGIAWQEIAVMHSDDGQPRLELSGKAREMAVGLGIAASHLSISDDGAYAIAHVTLERSPGQGVRGDGQILQGSK
jgi:holo-[acyl-carrier protein] synthase